MLKFGIRGLSRKQIVVKPLLVALFLDAISLFTSIIFLLNIIVTSLGILILYRYIGIYSFIGIAEALPSAGSLPIFSFSVLVWYLINTQKRRR